MYRSLPVLICYLSLAASLQFNTCRTIYARYRNRKLQNDWSTPQQRAQFFVFAILAVLSFSATWYYMFAFFAHSYQNWESSAGKTEHKLLSLPLVSRLELWLQNTKLFREAWETVIETPARFWWSGQIFLWTTGWSLFLGVMGMFFASLQVHTYLQPSSTARRYRVPHVWTYMLLGQIVAISFALNLFFATILVSRALQSVSDSSDADDDNEDQRHAIAWTPPLSLEVLPVAVSLLSTALVPSVTHTRYFMVVLLIPHLLLFVPAILRPSPLFGGGSAADASKDSTQNCDGVDATTRRYVAFFKWFLVICILLQAHATYSVISDIAAPDVTTVSYGVLVRRLLNAMYEHPAVSSVSWDVVFCMIGAVAWAMVHGGDMSSMLGGAQQP